IGDIFGRLEIDTLDRPGFPRLGMVGSVDVRGAYEGIGADDDASAVIANLGDALSVGNNTFRLKGIYASNVDENTTSPYIFGLGGFMNLSGYAPNSLVGKTKALGQAQYLYKFGKFAGYPFYGGLMAEWGGMWDKQSDMSESSGLWSGSTFAALDTGIGP